MGETLFSWLLHWIEQSTLKLRLGSLRCVIVLSRAQNYFKRCALCGIRSLTFEIA